MSLRKNFSWYLFIVLIVGLFLAFAIRLLRIPKHIVAPRAMTSGVAEKETEEEALLSYTRKADTWKEYFGQNASTKDFDLFKTTKTLW